MHIGSLGAHPKNLGGMYPAGKRCRNLCIDVVGEHGFLKENIEHAVVGVEEVPVDVASSRGAKFLSGSQYNIKQCKQDELLMGCFAVPHNHVQCKMLSHINWLLSKAADEWIFQGVRRFDAAHESEHELECNSEVSGLNLNWDFDTKTWTGTFVSGDHVGTTKHFSSTQLTKRHWQKLKEMFGSMLKDAKKASEKVITLWCQAVVDKTASAFETEWRLASEFETPSKKKRYHCASTP